MQAGTISVIISHFFQNQASRGDIERALREFFEIKSLAELPAAAPDFGDFNSPSHRYFHEWFIYDFKLSSGRSPLREWYEENPAKMFFTDMTVYADLLRENEYGFFRVISSVPGRVEVESFATNQHYTVREYKAAPFLVPNEAIIARVGLVGQRYEFVGGMIDRTDTEFSEEARKTFTHSRKPITPKEIYHMLHAPDRGQSLDKEVSEQEPFGAPTATVKEAKARMRKALKICDILPFVSVERVIKWIRGISYEDSFLSTSLLMGLVDDEASETDVDELIQAMTMLNNAIRAEENKEPNAPESPGVENKPRFRHDILDPFKWRPIYFRGVEQMKKGNIKKSLTLFNQAFKYLLEQQTTTREVYRLFANKGVSMIADGKLGGRYFIELALKLNPDYDFARQSLLRHDRELLALRRKGNKDGNKSFGFLAQAFAKMMTRSRNASKMMRLEDDPAQQYYVWLKKFGICFSKHTPIPTKRTIVKLSGKRK